MCKQHSTDGHFWFQRSVMPIYVKWVDDTLGFYLTMGKMGRIPVIGGLVRFFASMYGRYYHGGRAATVEECLEIVNSASQIKVVDCSCRAKEKRCNAPLKTCITVNTGAEIFGSIKKGESISPEKAADIIMESRSHGLIRAVHHCIEPDTYAICNCCTCCCVPYRLRSLFNINSAVENGFMVAEIDSASCKQCGKCFDVCPQKAILPENRTVRSKDCLGCGLCIPECRFDAVRMVKREKPVIPFKPGRVDLGLMFAVFVVVILPLGLLFRFFNRIK